MSVSVINKPILWGYKDILNSLVHTICKCGTGSWKESFIDAEIWDTA